MTAPTTGEPKIDAIAANAAAAASTATAWSGVCLDVDRTATVFRGASSNQPRPSRPGTSPRPREAIAASRMPGRSAGLVAPAFIPAYGT